MGLKRIIIHSILFSSRTRKEETMEEVREMFQIVKFVILIFAFIAIFIIGVWLEKNRPAVTDLLKRLKMVLPG